MEGISMSVAGGREEAEDSKKGIHQFSWNQQGSRVLEQLRALYLSPDQEGSAGDPLGIQPDVILFSGDGDFVEAHKMVLSLCSPFFQDLFLKISRAKSQKARDGGAVVVLNNLNSVQLKHLIQFMYTGQVSVSSDQMNQFLETARGFKIEGIGYSSAVPVPPSSLVISSATGAESVSTDSKEGANAKTPILAGGQDNAMDEEIDVSYDTYPVKMELDPQVDPMILYGGSRTLEEDPLASDNDVEEEDVSCGEGDTSDDEKDDPTFETQPSAIKRPRRGVAVTDAELATALNETERRKKLQTPVEGWSVRHPVAENVLKENWRIYIQKQCPTHSTTWFYCAFGKKRCPARLKKQTLKDGTVTWFTNQAEHNFHKKTAELPELSEEQRQFVLECLKGGATNSAAILAKFKAKGKSPPLKKLVGSLLHRLRKLNREENAENQEQDSFQGERSIEED